MSNRTAIILRSLAAVATVVFLAIVLFWKSNPPRPSKLEGHAMGTHWTLEWKDDEPDREALRKETAAILEHWEQVLSQWRENSDLSRHNRGEPATPDLARVIALADEIRKETGGAFDHHLLEQVHAAGFGPPGKGIDLSSIGKGFAVDRVHERLKQLGVRHFIFALAGEVRAEGEWQVDIEKPDPSSSTAFRSIDLHNRSIATSGNYRQYRQTGQGIISHIIDPRTGEPIIRPFSAVTVIADDCATASAWATAMFVLGPKYNNISPELEVIWQLNSD